MRWKRIGFAALFISLLAVAAAFILVPQYIRNTHFSYSENFRADVLSTVQISRDRFGVPVINAREYSDTFFAIGYVHSQDRLAVMEYLRAIALGAGNKVVAGDDGRILSGLAVMLDLRSRAESIVSELKEPYKSYLASYVRGINTAKAKRSFTKGYRSFAVARPWTESDCISIFALIEWCSAFQNNYEFILPVSEKRYSTIIEDFVEKGVPCLYPEKDFKHLEMMRSLKRIIRDRVGFHGNGFAVFVPPSSDSRARVAVRFEEESSIFPLYYPLCIESDGKIFSCITVAGIPFVQSSISQNFSFAVMNASFDAMDFLQFPLEKRNDGIYYNTQLEWKKIESKSVQLPSGVFNFRNTDAGPVISDLFQDSTDSICIVAERPRIDFRSIISRFDLMKSGTIGAASASIGFDPGYPKALFASDAVNAAKNFFGSIPVRQIKNKLFHERSYSPAVMNLSPRISYSGRGVFVCSGIVRDKEAFDLGEYRVYRFSEHDTACSMLQMSDITSTKLLESLISNESPMFAKISQPFVKRLTNVPVTSAKLAKTYLLDWKGDLSGSSISSTISYQVLFSFMAETLGDELAMDIRGINDNPQLVYEKLAVQLDRGESKGFDNISTPDEFETIDKVFNIAFLRGMRLLHRLYGPEMGKWQWNNVATSKYIVPFTRLSDSDSAAQYSAEDAHYEGAVTYSSETGISFMPRSAVCVMLWDTPVWSSNFSLSANPRSAYFTNMILSARVSPVDTNDIIARAIIQPLPETVKPEPPKKKDVK